MRKPVKISDRTRSVEFDDMFSFGPFGKIKVNTGGTTTIDTTTHSISVVPGSVSHIPILASAPPAVAGTAVPWILIGDYNTIQLVYPDGSNHGKQIVLSDITFTP
jgi:hypothetical protein